MTHLLDDVELDVALLALRPDSTELPGFPLSCGPGSVDVAHEYVEVAELDGCLDMLQRFGGHPAE